MWILLLSFFTAAAARGRYEFIDDADLPAFYRSAQLAQQAAALQTGPSPGGVPGTQLYSSYYPYHIYQPAVTESQGQTLAAAPVQYTPYLHYSPPQIYRPQSTSVVTTSGAQPRVLYSPYYYGHQAATSGQLAKNKKKVV